MPLCRRLLLAGLLLVPLAGCQPAVEPAKRYPIKGQILGVGPERQELTIAHEDIVGFMPAMTMTFPVVGAASLEGRVPGELVTAILEVAGGQARLTDIVHAGSAPVPGNTNQVAIATGLLSVGDEVPDAAFIDQDNVRRSWAEWKGSLTLVSFVYTTCPFPNVCPLMDQNFMTIQNAVAEDSQLRKLVKLISISVDPERDTPSVLKAHAAKRRSDAAIWTWLTGDKATIDRFAGRLGVSIVHPTNAPDISHSLRTALVGRDGRIRQFYGGSDWTPSTVLSDLRAAAGQP